MIEDSGKIIADPECSLNGNSSCGCFPGSDDRKEFVLPAVFLQDLWKGVIQILFGFF